MLPFDAVRRVDGMCYPDFLSADPMNYWIMWVALGVFSVASIAFVAYAERKGWPIGTGWIKAALTPENQHA